MKNNTMDDLAHIREMMERSSRFISLSGLSGIVAGCLGLVGAFGAYLLMQRSGLDYFEKGVQTYSSSLTVELLILAVSVLLLAVLFGIYFTVKKSRRLDLPIWTATTKKMIFSLGVPLVAGAVFCGAMLFQNHFDLIAPSLLIFYGLALINVEKYTYADVRFLGILELSLGLVALFNLGLGLVFWAIGFGVLHVLYGIILYKKYN
ncbi:hypothetical protein [Flavobacterium sp. NKUCC04_CG]|uniref:hypothetical protein n=1 Tax=Flavobacterium sp. NKUCC04_CG TaxID=2842121 RepID=UPI001C5AAC64|nr:hypothetical protein [Flavobacterium sp. NKUCC04_CG]MBW3519781.1 hypothetical protein [Flavobacterium sp. NKUCC04_CG]